MEAAHSINICAKLIPLLPAPTIYILSRTIDPKRRHLRLVRRKCLEAAYGSDETNALRASVVQPRLNRDGVNVAGSVAVNFNCD